MSELMERALEAWQQGVLTEFLSSLTEEEFQQLEAETAINTVAVMVASTIQQMFAEANRETRPGDSALYFGPFSMN